MEHNDDGKLKELDPTKIGADQILEVEPVPLENTHLEEMNADLAERLEATAEKLQPGAPAEPIRDELLKLSAELREQTQHKRAHEFTCPTCNGTYQLQDRVDDILCHLQAVLQISEDEGKEIRANQGVIAEGLEKLGEHNEVMHKANKGAALEIAKALMQHDSNLDTLATHVQGTYEDLRKGLSLLGSSSVGHLQSLEEKADKQLSAIEEYREMVLALDTRVRDLVDGWDADETGPVLFRAALNWFMSSDPWPASEQDQKIIEDWLNLVAKQCGHETWTVAFHKHGRFPKETTDEPAVNDSTTGDGAGEYADPDEG